MHKIEVTKSYDSDYIESEIAQRNLHIIHIFKELDESGNLLFEIHFEELFSTTEEIISDKDYELKTLDINLIMPSIIL